MLKLTNRDKAILRACAASQVLTTSQVRRLQFPDVTPNVVQRRLRKLAEAGYLAAMETRTCTDNLYALGKEGMAELLTLGWNVERYATLPKDLAHHLGVTDIRIGIERGLTHTPHLRLRYFFAYWELGALHWPYTIIPDAVFSLQNALSMQAAIEFDRNTESLAVFAKKLLQYQTLVRLHPFSTVILAAEERANLARLEQGLQEVYAAIPLLTVALEDLSAQGLAASCSPRAQILGCRTIAEQMEIDRVRLGAEGGT